MSNTQKTNSVFTRDGMTFINISNIVRNSRLSNNKEAFKNSIEDLVRHLNTITALNEKYSFMMTTETEENNNNIYFDVTDKKSLSIRIFVDYQSSQYSFDKSYARFNYGGNIFRKSERHIKIQSKIDVEINKKLIKKIETFLDDIFNVKRNKIAIENQNLNDTEYLQSILGDLNSIVKNIISDNHEVVINEYKERTLIIKRTDKKSWDSEVANIGVTKKNGVFEVNNIELSSSVTIKTVHNGWSKNIIENYKQTIELVEKLEAVRVDINKFLSA